MEYIDIYDITGKRTGKIIPRDSDYSELPETARLLIVHVCIFNSKNEMLLQRRSPKKDHYAGCWDVSAGGFAISGENSQEAIERELQEELGIPSSTVNMQFVYREPFSIVFDDFYAIKADIDIDSLTLQKEEVSEVAWFSETEAMAMLQDGSLIDYPAPLMRRMFQYSSAISEL